MEENLSGHISAKRLTAMLGTALTAVAGSYLTDPEVIEVMLNPDGRLWVDRLGTGREDTGLLMSAEDAERVIFIVASSTHTTCSKNSPILSAELPGTGARFQGILPPIVKRPVFTIRKKASRVFSLADYKKDNILTEKQSTYLKEAVRKRKNILVVGGTGSGKTTLTNALLLEIAKTNDRIVILEDTVELQCEAKDSVMLRTKDGVATMTELLKATMRLRPDRIVVGEVRGKEALALLKAWNTGHPGGVATAHADSAEKGLSRIEQLVEEAGVTASKKLISDAIDVIVYIEKTLKGRKIKEIVSVGYEGTGYKLQDLGDS